METPKTQPIIVYGHPFCGMLQPVVRMLTSARAEHIYINILTNETGRNQVAKINNGNMSVPTLVFPDGTTMTEPAARTLQSKLEDLGYTLDKRHARSEAITSALRSPAAWTTLAIFIYIVLRVLEII